MIFVEKVRCWGKSYPRLIEALGDYYNGHNPRIVLSFGKDCYPSNIKVINKNTHIVKDKILMNKFMDENNIRHPKTFYFPFNNLPSNNDECVIKRRYSTRGKNIRFSFFDEINIDELTPDDYVQIYIPFEREFRVGVDFFRVLGIREKLPDSINCKIKNSKSCYYETRHINKLKQFAWDVARKFNIDFTGIDIGEYLKSYIVIELNSAPTIGEYWAKLLANDLINLEQVL